MALVCPLHQTPLNGNGLVLHCALCQADYRLCAHCPDCGAQLERLQACGASNWFCNRCNELKSKSAVQAELVKISLD